jgi:hypothetical protein
LGWSAERRGGPIVVAGTTKPKVALRLVGRHWETPNLADAG